MHLPLLGREQLSQEQAVFQARQATSQADLTRQTTAVSKREEQCAEAEAKMQEGRQFLLFAI